MTGKLDGMTRSSRATLATATATATSPQSRRAGWGFLVGVAGAGGVAAVNLLATDRSVAPLGLLAAVPLVAASMSGVLGTMSAGAVAGGTAVLMGDYDHALWTRDLVVLVAGIAVATVIATAAAVMRRRRLRQLHNSRAVADIVQQTLLRPVPDRLEGVAVAAHYSSATRGANVGGDLYEVLTTPFGLRVLIGDVRGKGLPAVRMAGTALGAFREWAYQTASLADLTAQLDVSVARQADPEDFVTAVVAQVNATDVEFVNCGHPAPIIMTADRVAVLESDQPSLPLGLGVTPTGQRVPFAPGDRLLLFTDGVTDVRRRGRFFDAPAELAALREYDADELVRRLERRLVKFGRRRLVDDVAILLLERVDSATPTVRAFDVDAGADVPPVSR